MELDDAAPPGRLQLVLAALATHWPYVRRAVLAADPDGDDDAVSADGGLGTEWW